jgi:putative transposase
MRAEDHRRVYGGEPICKVVPIAPSTYYHCIACRFDPTKLSVRARRDTVLRPKTKGVWDDNY